MNEEITKHHSFTVSGGWLTFTILAIIFPWLIGVLSIFDTMIKIFHIFLGGV